MRARYSVTARPGQHRPWAVLDNKTGKLSGFCYTEAEARKLRERMNRAEAYAIHCAARRFTPLLALALLAAAALPDTVRISPSGRGARYHVAACQYLHGRGVLAYRAEAESLGYSACRRCFAPKTARPMPRPVEAAK